MIGNFFVSDSPEEYADILSGLRVAREMKYEEMVAILLDGERRRTPYDEKSMFSKGKTNKPYTPRTIGGSSKCTYCKKTGHNANRCFKRLDDLDAAGGANLVEIHSDEEEDPPSEQAQMAHLSIEDDFGPDSWAF